MQINVMGRMKVGLMFQCAPTLIQGDLGCLVIQLTNRRKLILKKSKVRISAYIHYTTKKF